MDDTVKLAKALGSVLSSADVSRRLRDGLDDGEPEFYNHEGEDDYVDFNFAGKGYRLQVQGPFDL